jgi:hypothetical protein
MIAETFPATCKIEGDTVLTEPIVVHPFFIKYGDWRLTEGELMEGLSEASYYHGTMWAEGQLKRIEDGKCIIYDFEIEVFYNSDGTVVEADFAQMNMHRSRSEDGEIECFCLDRHTVGVEEAINFIKNGPQDGVSSLIDPRDLGLVQKQIEY